MIRTVFKAVLMGIIIGFTSSCDNTSGDLPISGAISDAKDAKQAVSTLQQYEDTINTAWKELNMADSTKIADIKRLILEISYAKGVVTSEELTALQQLLAKSESIKLTPADQFKTNALRDYDVLTDSLFDKTLKATSKLKLAHKVKPIMSELEESINQDENIVIIKRAMYDEAAKKYNNFFKQKKSLMIQADSTLSNKPMRVYFDNVTPG